MGLRNCADACFRKIEFGKFLICAKRLIGRSCPCGCSSTRICFAAIDQFPAKRAMGWVPLTLRARNRKSSITCVLICGKQILHLQGKTDSDTEILCIGLLHYAKLQIENQHFPKNDWKSGGTVKMVGQMVGQQVRWTDGGLVEGLGAVGRINNCFWCMQGVNEVFQKL